jgi:hypothetical protein
LKKKEKNEKKASSGNNKLEMLYNKGKANYIWVHGVLRWGVMTSILFILFMSTFEFGFRFRPIIRNLFTKDSLIIILIFTAAGFLWANVAWWWISKRFKK